MSGRNGRNRKERRWRDKEENRLEWEARKLHEKKRGKRSGEIEWSEDYI